MSWPGSPTITVIFDTKHPDSSFPKRIFLCYHPSCMLRPSLPITSHFLCGYIKPLHVIFTWRGCLFGTKFQKRSYRDACVLAYTTLFNFNTFPHGFLFPRPIFYYSSSVASYLCFVLIPIQLDYTLWFCSQLTYPSTIFFHSLGFVAHYLTILTATVTTC